jgi:hypothetical protein
MELQNKFEEILDSYKFALWEDFRPEVSIECAKLCLEEQIKLLSKIVTSPFVTLETFNNELQDQLKDLKNRINNV